jgi:predicted AlkP superfamily phosphohydrolase/phosphomutase
MTLQHATLRDADLPREGAKETQMRASRRVLVVGFDSMEKDLVLEWARAGLMPNFARLLEEGSWGLIENPVGLVSGGTWSSFYSGVLPDRHGQYDAYDYFDTGSYQYATYRKSDLAFSPIWEQLDRSGKRVVVIDAPYSFLAENIKGVHVVDWGTHVRFYDARPATWPRELAEELETRFGQDPLGTDRGSPCDQEPPRTLAEYRSFRDKLLDRMDRKASLSTHLMKTVDWDFLLTVFCETHCIGHHCWHIHDPFHSKHDPALAQELGDPVEDVYVGIDRAFGRLLAEAGTDTTVLAYCSFGMGPHYSGTDLLDQILLRLEGIERETLKERATDILRNAWRHAPVGVRNLLMPLRRNVWEPIYQNAVVPQRSTRRFFEMKTNNSTGGIRINLVGREAQGIVRPGAEFDEICDHLTTELRKMTNPDSGEPLVNDVIRTDRLYHGEQLARLPDLLVQWNRSKPIVRASSPAIGVIENHHLSVRTGDHKALGLYLAIGPTAKPGKISGSVSVTDFAPTIAALLGVELARVDGKPISPVTEGPAQGARLELSPTAAP